MELVLGAGIGAAAAIVVLAAAWIVGSGPVRGALRRAHLVRDSRPTAALPIDPAPRPPDSASSTDWIRNTIGAPDRDFNRAGNRDTRSRCPVCRASIVRGAQVCSNCGAVVSERSAAGR